MVWLQNKARGLNKQTRGINNANWLQVYDLSQTVAKLSHFVATRSFDGWPMAIEPLGNHEPSAIMTSIKYATARVFAVPPASIRRQRTSVMVLTEFGRLLAFKVFGQITLTEVADGCGIARSTVYRLYANTTELLWTIAYPEIESLIDASLRSDANGFAAQIQKLVQTPGLVSALLTEHARKDVEAKITVLSGDFLQREGRERYSESRARILAALVLDCLVWSNLHKPALDADLNNYWGMMYLAAFWSPAEVGNTRLVENASWDQRFRPAVSVSHSLASDAHIISMIDGRPYRTLSRHIRKYGFTPDSYRECFNLPRNYPMVAPGYSTLRRELARQALPKAASQKRNVC